MKQFKLGFGPMSKEIITILAEHTQKNNYPLMIIASRNQVDYDSGYVCTSQELVDQVAPYRSEYLLVCRDHCGPYFSDLDQGLSIEDAMIRCKKTIAADVAAGFDLIHIDVSRINADQFYYAKELIEYVLSLSPSMKLEFGSENNTGLDINDSAERIADQLEFLKPYKNNVIFFVSQTGSLTKDNQIGKFDIESNRQLKETIHAAGFLFKEHNADYFTEEDIKLRIQAGVDSLNIAPQLGKLQTESLKEIAPPALWQKFSDYVYAQNYWQRWVAPGETNQDIAVKVSGHYCFNSNEYRAIMDNIDVDQFKIVLGIDMTNLLNTYKTFDSEHPDVCYQMQLKKRLEELRKRDPFIYR